MFKYFFLAAVLNYWASATPMTFGDSQGRNIVQFGNMISKALNVSALDYNGYGCWCGLGGKGAPVDDTDACCKAHDECYDVIIGDRWIFLQCSPYLAYYSWDIDSVTSLPYCKDTPGSCTYRVCECDRIVTECYRKHRSTFNKGLKCQ